MNESIFSRELRKSLVLEGAYFLKMTGGQFVTPGIPDLIGCYNGRFIAIECKQIKHRPKSSKSILWNHIFTDDQIFHLQNIVAYKGRAYGVIHLAYLRPQIALALSIINIQHLIKVTLGDIEELVLRSNHEHMVIPRQTGGVWDVTSFLEWV